MSERITFKLRYKFRGTVYHYEAVSCKEYDRDTVIADYRSVLGVGIRSKFESIVSRASRSVTPVSGVLKPNYTKLVRIGLVPPKRGSFYSHYTDPLKRMEKRVTPPRHVWDKEFPKSIYFRMTIYHVVRPQLSREDISRKEWMSTLIDTFEEATIASFGDTTAWGSYQVQARPTPTRDEPVPLAATPAPIHNYLAQAATPAPLDMSELLVRYGAYLAGMENVGSD